MKLRTFVKIIKKPFKHFLIKSKYKNNKDFKVRKF